MNRQIEQIDECWDIVEEYELDQRLKSVYDMVPEGDCIGCGRCCSESVPISFFELMMVDAYLAEVSINEELAKRIVEFYFTEFIERRQCPFLSDEKKCLIYNVRPLTCRIYGHMTEEADKDSYNRVLMSNKENSQLLYENFGIVVPDEVINFKIPYCKDFKSMEKMTLEEREKLEMSLLNIDLYFVMEEIIEAQPYSLGLVHGIMYNHDEPSALAEERVAFCSMSIEERSSVIDRYAKTLINFYQKK